MTPIQIKIHLWQNGLTVSKIARELESEYDAKFDSIRTMLTDLFYRGRYNERLATLVFKRYGIAIDREAGKSVRAALMDDASA